MWFNRKISLLITLESSDLLRRATLANDVSTLFAADSKLLATCALVSPSAHLLVSFFLHSL